MKDKIPKIVLVLVALIFVVFRMCSADVTSIREGTLGENGVGRLDLIIKAMVDLNGKIQVITNQTGDIRAKYKITATAESSTEAARFLDLVDVKMTAGKNDRAILEILAPSHVPWGGTRYSVNVDILIAAPEKIDIEGRCRFIDMDVVGPFQNITFDCENSAVSLSRIYGSIRVNTTNSEINLSSVSGDIRAKTTNGDVNVKGAEVVSGYAFLETTNGIIVLDGIRGSVEAYTTYSPIKAEDIDASEGSVVLRTNYAPINISKVSGEVICETNYYPINVTKAVINHGHSKLETSFAPVKAQIVDLENCEVYITSEYSDVELEVPEESSTRLVASVDKGGNIHTKDIAIVPILLEPTRLEGILGDGEARVEIKVNGVGNIEITGH